MLQRTGGSPGIDRVLAPQCSGSRNVINRRRNGSDPKSGTVPDGKEVASTVCGDLK